MNDREGSPLAGGISGLEDGGGLVLLLGSPQADGRNIVVW